MKKAIAVFGNILNDTKNSAVVYDHLESVIRPPFDYSDLLRWQLAQAVSALDKLIHDLIRTGIIEIFQNQRALTAGYGAFVLNLSMYNEFINNPGLEVQILDRHILIVNGYKTYQDPEKIAEGLSIIWTEADKWKKIADKMCSTKILVKSELKNIVIRRNQIVHEGDYNASSAARQGVVHGDIKRAVKFIDDLGNSIYQCIK